MVESKKLKHFIELAKLGNFNEAAIKLHISQPALTRSIQSLEAALGIVLFDRSQRAIKLTYAGQELLKQTQIVMQDLDNLTLQADRLNSLEMGKIVVGTGPLPAEHISARACSEFLNQYPKIQTSLLVDDVNTMLPKLMNGEMDLIIADPRIIPDLSDLSIVPLPAYQVVTVARYGHPLVKCSGLSYQALKQYPRAKISQLMNGPIAEVLALTDQDEIDDLFTFDCNSVQLLISMIKQSNMIAILLSCNISEDVKNQKLSILDVPEINNSLMSQYSIITYQPRIKSLVTDKFIEIINQVADDFVLAN